MYIHGFRARNTCSSEYGISSWKKYFFCAHPYGFRARQTSSSEYGNKHGKSTFSVNATTSDAGLDLSKPWVEPHGKFCGRKNLPLTHPPFQRKGVGGAKGREGSGCSRAT